MGRGEVAADLRTQRGILYAGLPLPTFSHPLAHRTVPDPSLTNPTAKTSPARLRRLVLLAGIFAVCGAFWGVVFIFPSGPLQSVDFVGILVPYQEFFRAHVLHGELPLWNPYASLGRPFLADPQAVGTWPGSLAYVIFGVPIGAWLLLTLHSAWAIVSVCSHGMPLLAGRHETFWNLSGSLEANRFARSPRPADR